MNTYTIIATDSWEKLDNTYLSLVCSLRAEERIEISYDGGATSAELPAGILITISFQNPILYVKGNEAKKIWIYNGAISTVSDSYPLSGSGSPEGQVIARRPGDIYTDNDSGLTYINPAISDTGWAIISYSTLAPLYGSGSPDGAVMSRYIGDLYIDQDGPNAYISSKVSVTARLQIYNASV